MATMALIFVGLSLLVLLAITVSTIYFVPRVLAEEDHGESDGPSSSERALP